MSRSIDRPEGRRPAARPRSVRTPASPPKLPPAVKRGLDWCDWVRFDLGPAKLPQHEWGDWADELVSLPEAEGGDL